ncbi:MAG TPA: nuclear transport factor 2 family protein [Bacteroidia bacterium]|jgi:hypothetical protein|nr:nuclear transport factor 2 family protein [Bacteroidia bacterium]
MKKINIVISTALLLLFIGSCTPPPDTDADLRHVDQTLDQLNLMAANADFYTYFELFTPDAVFIGTDATEHWDKKSFMEWAKPRFDEKKTWHFESIDRHIYFNKTLDFAWFDELLKTRMKICRGSGVLIKQNNKWKIQQYVLSMTIPNSLTDTVVKIKTTVEDELIKKLDVK